MTKELMTKELSIDKKRRLVRKTQLIAQLHGVDITVILDGDYSCGQHCRRNLKGCFKVDDKYYFNLTEINDELFGCWCFAWLDKKYYKA